MDTYLISDIMLRDRSPEYAFALEMHDKALSRKLILVDGVNQPAAAK